MGLRALEVEVLDSSGKHLATHPRAYGQASTNSEDPSMQLALLCNKPASWPNSRVRDALPDPLREWLDRQDRQTRNEALQTLKRVDRESGWANAVEAMLSILESTDLEHWTVTDGSSQQLILRKGDRTYGEKGFWAPQYFKDKRTYYFTYTAN